MGDTSAIACSLPSPRAPNGLEHPIHIIVTEGAQTEHRQEGLRLNCYEMLRWVPASSLGIARRTASPTIKEEATSMKMRKTMATVLLAASLGLTACSGSFNVSAPPLQGGGGGQVSSALQAYDTTQSSSQLKGVGDLQLYRCDLDKSTNQWTMYYYSPSQQKSYQAVQNNNQVVLTVVQDASLAFHPGDEIDHSKWHVDSDKAAQVATQTLVQNVSQTTHVTINVSQVTITNLYLISAAQFQSMTGVAASAPVWVCQLQAPVPSTAPSASPSAMPTMTPSASPTATPTASPTAAPSASPTTGGTTINNITNVVYIDAGSGNQIQVGGTGNTQMGGTGNTQQSGSGNAQASVRS